MVPNNLAMLSKKLPKSNYTGSVGRPPKPKETEVKDKP